jgi:hypothetical protein
VMSASIYVPFRLVPRESALFSRSCMPTSLGVVPCQVTAKASALPASGVCPGSRFPKGYHAGVVWSKAIDFYEFSWGVPRIPACNVVETTQRKSQHIAPMCTMRDDAIYLYAPNEKSLAKGIAQRLSDKPKIYPLCPILDKLAWVNMPVGRIL